MFPFYADVPLSRISKASKDIQGFKLNIVRTATSVTKIISRKNKLNSMYTWKKGADFSETSESKLFLARSNA